MAVKSEERGGSSASLNGGRRPITPAAGLIAVIVLVLAAYGLATIPPGDELEVLITVSGIVAATSLGLSGAFLIARLPGNPIGWCLGAGGLLYAWATSGPAAGAALYEAGIGPALR